MKKQALKTSSGEKLQDGQTVDELMEHVRRAQDACEKMGIEEQDRQLDNVLNLYRCGGTDLLGVFFFGIIIAGLRSEEHFRRNIPFEERRACFQGFRKVAKGKQLTLIRRAFLGDIATA